MPSRICRTLVACTIAASLALPASAQTSISLDVRDLDIYDAVRLLSTQAGENVVVDSSVAHHPVTMRLKNVSFDEALASLAQSNDLETARVGKVTYLGMSDVINRRYPASRTGASTTIFPMSHSADPTELARALGDALPHGTIVEVDRRNATVVVTGSRAALDRARDLVTTFDAQSNIVQSAIPMRYAKAADALKALQATLPNTANANSYASDQQNEIVLSGPADYVAQASAMIDKVDRPGQQVRYEVRVTDISPSDSSDIGFLYGGTGPGGVFSSSFLTNSYALNVTLNALQTKNEAKVLARPTLSTLNNVQATLLVGEQYPIVYFDARTGTQQVQFVNIGVNLMVTPTIGSDGSITTDLETDYSQPAGTIGVFPIINTRKAQSTLRVHSGETIVIAGLFEDIDSTTLTKVPFLGDIPILGEVFRNREKSHVRDEIVFLITPHLVGDDDTNKAQLPAGVAAQ